MTYDDFLPRIQGDERIGQLDAGNVKLAFEHVRCFGPAFGFDIDFNSSLFFARCFFLGNMPLSFSS